MRKIYITSVYIGSTVFVLCYSRSLGPWCDERGVCVQQQIHGHGQGGGLERITQGSTSLILLAASEFDCKPPLRPCSLNV